MSGGLTKQAGMLTGSRAVGQILNVLAGLLVVRALAQHDYGTYRQLILLYTTVFLLGEAGFAQSLYHFIPRERERARIFIGQAMLAALVMAALWTVVLVGLSGGVSDYFSNPSLAGYLPLLAAYLGLSLLAKVPESGLVALERAPAVSLNVCVSEALKFVLVVAALKANARISWILMAMVIAAALRLLHLLYKLHGEIKFSITSDFSAQWSYSMSLWLPGILNIAAVYAHQYIVGHNFSPSDFAIYSVACFQVPFMGVLASSVNEVFLVRATQYVSVDRRADVVVLWNNAVRKSLLIYVPVTAGLAVLSAPLVESLFTPAYLAAAPLLAVLLLAIPFHGLYQDAIFRACHVMRVYSFFYLLRVVLAVGLGVAGVIWFGMWGAAVSAVLATALLNAAQLVMVAKLLQVTWRKILPWRAISRIGLAALAAALPAMLSARWLQPAWLALTVGVMLYAIVYLLLIGWLKLVTRADFAEFTQGVSRLRILRPKSTVLLAALAATTLLLSALAWMSGGL